MKISSMNWKDVENFLKTDSRCILPIGCTEQHAFLSLATDSILAEKISIEAAAPFKIPVFPVVSYGHTPLFMEYPGTVSIGIETLWNFVRDIIDSLAHHGFRNILIVNGHGGNAALKNFMENWTAENRDVKIKFHNWWNAPHTWKKVTEIDNEASHASWMENFLWTRLKDVEQPKTKKQMADIRILKNSNPKEAKEILGDGSFGGYYQRSDQEMAVIWEAAVNEVRDILNSDW